MCGKDMAQLLGRFVKSREFDLFSSHEESNLTLLYLRLVLMSSGKTLVIHPIMPPHPPPLIQPSLPRTLHLMLRSS